MTTNNVVSDQHSVVIQNTANGQVDFLRFNGSTLQSSAIRDYGLSGWTVVGNGDLNGDGNADLVAQNNTTGQLDFLFLNATGNLTASALSNVPVPHAVGVGEFNGPTPNVVTQLANGQLDILSFNYTGRHVDRERSDRRYGGPAYRDRRRRVVYQLAGLRQCRRVGQR